MGKMMTDKEKETMAIKMLNQGCTSRQIHKACKISPNTLVTIRRKLNGVSPPPSMHTQAYTLFKTMKPLEVAIKLGITATEARKYYHEYLMLERLDELLNLCTTLGTKAITQMKLLHRALVRNGISPNLYPTYFRKATRMTNLISEDEKLGQQNSKIKEENVALKQEKGQLEWKNNELKQTKKGLNYEIDQLKREKKVLETDVSNLEKREMVAFDNIDRLDAEIHELELKKKQLDASIKTLQVNFDDRLKTLTEDLGLYVIEAIRKYAGQKLGNVTIDDLIDDTAHFGGILREMLEEPSGEFLESLINAP